jgi:hypothetical protein
MCGSAKSSRRKALNERRSLCQDGKRVNTRPGQIDAVG